MGTLVSVTEDRLLAAVIALRSYVEEQTAERTRRIVGLVTAIVTVVVGAATSVPSAVLG